LDKESNTIAILCQDVTVVLAFDTRERLIQWQVKIANNLGEGKTKSFCIVDLWDHWRRCSSHEDYTLMGCF
jgi:hypothetical protein